MLALENMIYGFINYFKFALIFYILVLVATIVIIAKEKGDYFQILCGVKLVTYLYIGLYICSLVVIYL